MAPRAAIVTASGRGIGEAVARRLAADGYRLALMSPSGASEALAAELDGYGVTGSVTATDDLAKLVAGTMERYGRIDAVVNHTGHPPKGPLLEIPDADWHRGLDLVMLNVIRMARLVTPIMVAQGGGAIVNISTFAVFEPSPVFPVSAALRAALAAFTKLYSDEYVDSLPETEERRSAIPMGRYGTVAEIAATAAFLLSADAGYVTGQNLRVDGGLTRSV